MSDRTLAQLVQATAPRLGDLVDFPAGAASDPELAELYSRAFGARDVNAPVKR